METNPNFPAVIGTQLTPRTNFQRGFYKPVSSSADVVMERLPSTVTQSVTAMAKWFRNLTPIAPAPNVMVEVVPTGSEVPTGMASATYLPNASSQSGVTGTWADLLGGGSGVYNTATDAYGEIHLDFGTAGVLAGKRIRRVQFLVDVNAICLNGTADIAVEFAGAQVFQNSPYVIAQGIDVIAQTQRLVFDTGEIFPDGGVFWTPARVQQLDAGTARLDLILNTHAGYYANDGSEALIGVMAVSAVVDYCDENRVTRDIIDVGTAYGSPLPAWTSWVPHKPDGTANLAKVNATPLTVITRQFRSGDLIVYRGYRQAAILLVPTLTPLPAAMPDVILDSVLNADGTVARVGTARRDLFTPTDLVVTGVMSVDAQPWAFPDDQDGIPITTRQQEFTQSTGGPVTVAGVQLLGKYQVGTDGLVNDLTVRLRRRSDNVVVATATLTQAMADAAEEIDTGFEHYSLLQVPWVAPFAMVTAVQYYVDLTSARPDDWAFPALRVSDLGAGPAQSWHGATDAATITAENTAYDYPWLLYQAIPTPTDLTAVGLSQPVDVAAELCDGLLRDDCLVYAIGLIHLTWASASIGALFDYYELQRQDQYGTWTTIAYLNDPLVTEFYDFEARLGLTSSYRVRLVTTVGIIGPWSATANGTAPVSGTGLTFTSNAFPAGNLAYSDVYADTAERVWRNLEAEELLLHKLAGRDFQVAFQPCERRGVAWSSNLLVNAMGAPSTVGIHAFDALRDLAKAHLPYVCVRDERGDRWFVAMQVPEVRIKEPAEFYTSAITCTEVMGQPAPTVQ